MLENIAMLIAGILMLISPSAQPEPQLNSVDITNCPYVDTAEEAKEEIGAALAEACASFALRFEGEKELEAAYDALYQSQPYVNDYSASEFEADDDIGILFSLDYTVGYEIVCALKNSDETGMNDRQRTTLERARGVLEELNLEGVDDLGRELAIHDWLVSNVTYTEGEDCEDAYGALVNGKAHCMGYTDAFYLLCSLEGLEAGYIGGEVDGGGHAWNTLRLGEKSYFVDVTWNDADDVYAPAHEYFNVPGPVLFETHEPDNEYDVPKDIAGEYDENSYFAYAQRLVEDDKGLYWALKGALEGREDYVQVACESPLNIEDCLYKLADDVAGYYGDIDDLGWYDQKLGGLYIYDVWFNDEYYE